jgi:hypothetical protein
VVINDPNNDDHDEADEKPKETEEQRRNRKNTNRLGQDAYEIEGDVVGVRLSASDPIPSILENQTTPLQFDPNKGMPYIVIATKDGLVQIELQGDAVEQGKSARPGQYAMVTGQKDNEYHYYAEDVDLKDKRKSVIPSDVFGSIAQWLGLVNQS